MRATRAGVTLGLSTVAAVIAATAMTAARAVMTGAMIAVPATIADETMAAIIMSVMTEDRMLTTAMSMVAATDVAMVVAGKIAEIVMGSSTPDAGRCGAITTACVAVIKAKAQPAS